MLTREAQQLDMQTFKNTLKQFSAIQGELQDFLTTSESVTPAFSNSQPLKRLNPKMAKKGGSSVTARSNSEDKQIEVKNIEPFLIEDERTSREQRFDRTRSPCSDEVPSPSHLLASAEAESMHPLIQSQTHPLDRQIDEFMMADELDFGSQ